MTENLSAAQRSTTHRLGDYELIRRVGAGAYADVWLAKDAVGKYVAVKVIDRERLMLMSRRNREEEALGLLRTKLPEHPHLIRVHHVGKDESRFYYVMDLADDAAATTPDSSIQASIKVGSYQPLTLDVYAQAHERLTVGEAIAIIKDLLSAVACLHDRGFLHRDIKPSNVVRVGGQWKLADIGLLTVDTTEVTAVGTPAFMPPSGRVDRSADLYAIGKMLYCLVSGRSPRNFPQIPSSILHDDNRKAIAEVNDVIVSACSSVDANRYQSAKEFVQALDASMVRIESGMPMLRRMRRRTFIGCVVAAMAMTIFLGWGMFTENHTGSHLPDKKWTPLFNGQDLSGWYKEESFHGNWHVHDGAITVERNDEFKTLLTKEVYGPGTIRATITPSHEGTRMGIGYLHPRGPLFMMMGKKYTWIRGYRKNYPPDEVGNWRSFPGPIPHAGESVELEIEYNPDQVLLSVNGVVLQELPGVQGDGKIALHVWKDDTGGFTDIEFKPHT